VVTWGQPCGSRHALHHRHQKHLPRCERPPRANVVAAYTFVSEIVGGEAMRGANRQPTSGAAVELPLTAPRCTGTPLIVSILMRLPGTTLRCGGSSGMKRMKCMPICNRCPQQLPHSRTWHGAGRTGLQIRVSAQWAAPAQSCAAHLPPPPQQLCGCDPLRTQTSCAAALWCEMCAPEHGWIREGGSQVLVTGFNRHMPPAVAAEGVHFAALYDPQHERTMACDLRATAACAAVIQCSSGFPLGRQ
jgi:hypothetical protein